jgi:hypothetical protein
MTREEKQDVQEDIIRSALKLLYLYGDNGEASAKSAEARKQIARIEKLFGFDPYSFSA